MRFALRFSCLLPLLLFFVSLILSTRMSDSDSWRKRLGAWSRRRLLQVALTVLRRHLNRPPSLFDRHEAIQLLESLVRLARTQAHDKAEEYSAALDEVKARQASLESGHLQRLMLGLVGDPLRAKMAKEATSILKGVSRSQPSGSHDNRTRRRMSPYPVQCFSCHG